jgi:hypothetical protein
MSQPLTRLDLSPRHRFDRPAPHAPVARPDDDPAGRRTGTADEDERAAAMDQDKRRSGRAFPTWSEGLEVLRSLGYAQPPDRPAPPREGHPGRRRPRVRIDRDQPAAATIAAALAHHGGVRVETGAARIYEFPSPAAAEAALGAVRAAHGWTSVEPQD